jgi:predicted HTH transcriptional regulator
MGCNPNAIRQNRTRTDRHLEIFNPGSFHAGLTPDDFINGRERLHLRNPKIAEIFYYTKNIDR